MESWWRKTIPHSLELKNKSVSYMPPCGDDVLAGFRSRTTDSGGARHSHAQNDNNVPVLLFYLLPIELHALWLTIFKRKQFSDYLVPYLFAVVTILVGLYNNLVLGY